MAIPMSGLTLQQERDAWQGIAVEARERLTVLEALARTAKNYWVANNDGHRCGGKSGEWCDGCHLREALKAAGFLAS